MNFLNNKEGKFSVTRTAFIVGFLTVTIKLLASGITINGLKLETFSGIDYGAALAALGGIYVINKKRKVE